MYYIVGPQSSHSSYVGTPFGCVLGKPVVETTQRPTIQPESEPTTGQHLGPTDPCRFRVWTIGIFKTVYLGPDRFPCNGVAIHQSATELSR